MRQDNIIEYNDRRRVAAALACAFMVAMSQTACARDLPSVSAMVVQAIERHTQPAFAKFEANAKALSEAMPALCTERTPEARAKAGDRFRETVESWAAVEFLRFGPLAKSGRRERVSFWPDPRGVRERQIRPILAKRDPATLENIKSGRESAAVQGLPALEALLFDETTQMTADDDDGRYRCAVASAIASNVASIASDLSAEWSAPGGWHDKMLRPGSDNDTYKEPEEAGAELVKALLTGLQIIADQQVKPRVDSAQNNGKPFPAPFKKSGLSAVYFESGVRSLDALYNSLGLVAYLPDDKSWVEPWIAGAFSSLEKSDGAGGAARGVAANEAPSLKEVSARLGGLRQLIGREVATAAGLTIGFNELDGD